MAPEDNPADDEQPEWPLRDELNILIPLRLIEVIIDQGVTDHLLFALNDVDSKATRKALRPTPNCDECGNRSVCHICAADRLQELEEREAD